MASTGPSPSDSSPPGAPPSGPEVSGRLSELSGKPGVAPNFEALDANTSPGFDLRKAEEDEDEAESDVRPSYDSLDLPVPYQERPREESTSAFALVQALSKEREPEVGDVREPRVRAPPKRDEIPARYRITQKIGSGGTATVYEAQHTALDRPVAIKVLSPDGSERQAERLRREARALSRLRHPSIIEVLDLDETLDGRPFMVMELLAGIDLHSRLRTGRLPADLVIDLGTQLCSALSAAHALGVVHRDLKPANVFLARTADAITRLKLLDFGMAQVEGVSKLSAEGTVIGTPAYLAPEQVLAQPIDQRTDVYGASLVMYEMLTGVQPFSTSNKLDVVVSQILAALPPKPSEVGADTPLLDEVIMRGLAKKPENRWPTTQALSQALSAAHWQLRARSSQVEILGSKSRVRAIEIPLPRPQAPPPPPEPKSADPRSVLFAALAFALGTLLGLANRLI
ncbi:MAG: serine/threonine protein kinase [Deltaproteobacteria bacterium]|nr:serine/threonine protein kinase [Deltaproteobacteria bacterium]